MIPEQIAENVGLGAYCPCWRVTTFDGRHEAYCPIFQVAAAIRAERERMALACEALTKRRAAEMGLASYEHLTGWQCAALIREGGNTRD